MSVGTTPSLDYDLWAWQHASPTHVTVDMQKYANGPREVVPETWNKIAMAIEKNPHISQVQLDIDTVTDRTAVQTMVASLISLCNLNTLHVRTLQSRHIEQSLMALDIVTAVAQTSTSLRHVHVQGLWFADTTMTELFCRLLSDETGIQEWTWSHIECASPELEARIALVWSKNIAWSAWKLTGRVPVQWLQAAVVACQTTTHRTHRSFSLESVIMIPDLWCLVEDLLCKTNNTWCLNIRAMNLDGESWRALSRCPQLSRVVLEHCCIDATFPLTSLSQLVSSMEFTWNRLADETQLVELLNMVYQTPKGPHCRRQRLVLYHHWCQVFDWELITPSDLASLVSPDVQWKGTRWPSSVVQRLEFLQFLRECHCNQATFAEKISQHFLGSSVLFHTLREYPTLLLNSEWGTMESVAA